MNEDFIESGMDLFEQGSGGKPCKAIHLRTKHNGDVLVENHSNNDSSSLSTDPFLKRGETVDSEDNFSDAASVLSERRPLQTKARRSKKDRSSDNHICFSDSGDSEYSTSRETITSQDSSQVSSLGSLKGFETFGQLNVRGRRWCDIGSGSEIEEEHMFAAKVFTNGSKAERIPAQSGTAPASGSDPSVAKQSSPPKAQLKPSRLEFNIDSMLDVFDKDDDEEDFGEDVEQDAVKLAAAQAKFARLIQAVTDGSMTEEELIAQVPCNDCGQPTSIGAVLHESGGCKACVFLNSKPGCNNGVKCNFCHLYHHKGRRRKNKLRPCKGKRERYRKLLIRMTEKINEDDTLDLETMEFPPSVLTDEVVKKNLFSRLRVYQEEVRAAKKEALEGFSQESAKLTL